MAKKSNLIGSWAFLIGVVLAIVLAFVPAYNTNTIMWVLVAIGILVGLLNIADKETQPFLMSGAVLIIASALGGSAVSVSAIFARVLDALLLIFVPATVIVAIKNVFSLSKK